MVVSTTAFVQAAEVQSKSLGHEPTMVWVPHPIQDRTDEELRALADRAFDEIVEGLTGRADVASDAEVTFTLRGYGP